MKRTGAPDVHTECIPIRPNKRIVNSYKRGRRDLICKSAISLRDSLTPTIFSEKRYSNFHHRSCCALLITHYPGVKSNPISSMLFLNKLDQAV